LGGKGRRISEFKASLVYRVRVEKPCQKTKQNKTKQNKTNKQKTQKTSPTIKFHMATSVSLEVALVYGKERLK
jgi:hypothetical protein